MKSLNQTLLRACPWYFVCLLFLGCQTSPIVEFSRINLGQDKSDVIEHAGGPSWKDRKNGMDRWTYILFQDGVRLERQVLFADGIVAYVGDPIEPFISAEEQDLINAEKNKELDRMERAVSSAPHSNSRRSSLFPGEKTVPIEELSSNTKKSSERALQSK